MHKRLLLSSWCDNLEVGVRACVVALIWKAMLKMGNGKRDDRNRDEALIQALRTGARYTKFNFEHEPRGSNSSEHAIFLAAAVDQGLLSISEVPKDGLKEIIAFAASAGKSGVSRTYYRDLIERRRNEIIVAIGEIKAGELAKSRNKNPRRGAAAWLESASRTANRARDRGRPFVVADTNPEMRELVADYVRLQLLLVEMGTRRNGQEGDESGLLREGQLHAIMWSRPRTVTKTKP